MAVANVAWLLASRGHRVLAIDWDLEAPGLHRYFEPFLTDQSLINSTGLIDFVLEFFSAAVAQASGRTSPDWYMGYANILAHATPVAWDFPNAGVLHLVPAGRQDAAYAVRVNSFDWRQFYEKLGGGIWLEEVKQRIRQRYDYILIDSRTGVSDTSGICTVQMPDDLAVCFTLNQQSTLGASAVAYSALQQRRAPDGSPTLTVWPLPMRVEAAEQDRLETARAVARTRFSRVLGHLSPSEEDRYWGEIEVSYFPLYAYEELLAPFGDRARQTRTLLASMEKFVTYLTRNESGNTTPMAEDRRLAGLRKFTTRSASDYLEDLRLMAEEYERIRATMESGGERTYLLTALTTRATLLAGREGAAQVAEFLFKLNTDGTRVIALSLAVHDLRRTQIDLAIEGIGSSRSAFEQYHALVLAERLVPLLDPTAKEKLREAVQAQIGSRLERNRSDRSTIANAILKALGREQLRGAWASSASTMEVSIGHDRYTCVEIRPPASFVPYTDVEEQHGPWVQTRNSHALELPRVYRLGRDLVTNAVYHTFVQAGGYEREEYWRRGMRHVKRFLTADGKTPGPASWPGWRFPEEKYNHPVTGICFLEVEAFVTWLNQEVPAANWYWSLPLEDMWEYAARTEAGLTYPWGDAFAPDKCNCIEAGIGDTSDVERFVSGASRHGCRDMAGNVWEYVVADDAGDSSCVLRGGSYKNDRFEIRSYLRLFGVPLLNRPPDFGFRVAQWEAQIPIAGA